MWRKIKIKRMDALTPSFGHPSPWGEGQGGEGNVCVRDGSGKPEE